MKNRNSIFKGSDGIDLFYQVWETETEKKAAVILVHGIGEHCGRYPALINTIVPRGYNVYALEHRGHGHSSGKRGHINNWDEYRQDLRIFVQMVVDMEPDKPVYIYGHSLGGLMALDYVLYYPQNIKGIIASAPSLAINTSPVLILLAKMMSSIVPGFTLSTNLDASAISRKKEVVEEYINDPLVHSLASARMGTELLATMDWTNAHAADLHMPILILQGSADRITPAPSSQTFIEKVSSSDKQRIEYPGGYHESHNDVHAEQAMMDVANWLDNHLSIN
ncbi:MAG: lysophospholipase [Chloroflexota bacterium]|jgi:alpha-beta hydrolase superfamily lysophospholipase